MPTSDGKFKGISTAGLNNAWLNSISKPKYVKGGIIPKDGKIRIMVDQTDYWGVPKKQGS